MIEVTSYGNVMADQEVAALKAEIEWKDMWLADWASRALDAEAELTRFLGKDWVCFVTERDARIATARADALEEAARVAKKTAPDTANFAPVWTDYEYAVNDTQNAIAAAIRALALTQPASTQTLTDQGETSTAGEVAPKDSEYKYPGSDWYRDNVGGGVEP